MDLLYKCLKLVVLSKKLLLIICFIFYMCLNWNLYLSEKNKKEWNISTRNK